LSSVILIVLERIGYRLRLFREIKYGVDRELPNFGGLFEDHHCPELPQKNPDPYGDNADLNGDRDRQT